MGTASTFKVSARFECSRMRHNTVLRACSGNVEKVRRKSDNQLQFEWTRIQKVFRPRFVEFDADFSFAKTSHQNGSILVWLCRWTCRTVELQFRVEIQVKVLSLWERLQLRLFRLAAAQSLWATSQSCCSFTTAQTKIVNPGISMLFQTYKIVNKSKAFSKSSMHETK